MKQKNKFKKQTLKRKRNSKMREIHHKLKTEREENEIRKINSIENAKDDSNKMFKAMRLMNKEKPKEKILIKLDENTIIVNEDETTKTISKFFENIFNKSNVKDIENVNPTKMKTPFTEIEVENAINKLKNDKSPGTDNITPEQLKCAPKIVHKHIADIFNNMAETGTYPKEIKQGILIPLQKPGKEKGKLDNLRPVILLNTLR